MRYGLPLLAWVVALQVHGQQERIPGPPPDEYVDVTGDGRADLLITSRTIHISDPEQPGYLGMYKLGVRTISGNAVLLWSTPSTQRWFTLDSAARLDTAALSKRIHYKQLSWTDEDKPTEFWLLERPFGPAITKDQDGWYGTGDHHDGRIMVLRSANDLGTSVAAFTFELPFPYGRIVVRSKEAVHVPNGYGEEGDPIPMKPVVKDGYDFGHEPNEPQVMVPPGLPPDEAVDLHDDGTPDVAVTARDEHWHGTGNPGYHVRGIAPLPGTSFLLMRDEGHGPWVCFRLPSGAALTPDELNAGLASGTYFWSLPSAGSSFCPVLQHPFGSMSAPAEWTAALHADDGDLVYRTTYYDQTVIGALELRYALPGGELGVTPQNWVEEGQVLQVR